MSEGEWLTVAGKLIVALHWLCLVCMGCRKIDHVPERVQCFRLLWREYEMWRKPAKFVIRLTQGH